MSGHRTIVLIGDPVRKEAIANAGTIYPGMLLYMLSTGKVAPHNVEGGNTRPMFALEDENQGKEIDTLYASGDRVFYGVFKPGDEVNALLEQGQNIAIGDPLESNGAGYLQKHTPGILPSSSVNYGDCVVAYAMEALDLSSSSGAEGAEPTSQRLRIEIA